MSLKYVITRIDIAEPTASKPRGFARTMIAYRKYEKRMSGPVILGIDGDTGPDLTIAEAGRRMRRKLIRAGKGFRIKVHPAGGPEVAIRKVEVKDPLEPANIYATDSIRIIYAWLHERFDFVYDGGLYAAKPGMHGTKPPNAYDAMVSYSSSDEAHARVMTVYHALQAQALLHQQSGGRQGLPVNGAIGMDDVFGPYGYTPSRHYSGEDHVTHCHVSGLPVPPGLGGWI